MKKEEKGEVLGDKTKRQQKISKRRECVYGC